jgi:hypothetical protein
MPVRNGKNGHAKRTPRHAIRLSMAGGKLVRNLLNLCSVAKALEHVHRDKRCDCALRIDAARALVEMQSLLQELMKLTTHLESLERRLRSP